DATVTTGADLRAVTQVKFVPRGDGDRALSFLLDANLRVESVKDPSGAALAFFQPRDPKDRNQSYGDYVVVVLREPTRAGQELALDFGYAGKRIVRKEGSGTFFCQSSGWYPGIENDFASRADFEMTFHSPKRYTFVATGDKISETKEGDASISTWRSSIPLAVAGFAYGDYKVELEKAGNIDIEIYANRQEDDIARSIQVEANPMTPAPMGSRRASDVALGDLAPAHRAKDMATEMANTIRVFEKYFGPYPYKHLAVSSLPLGYSYGQGWPMLIYLWSLSFLDSQQRHTLGIRDQVELTDFFRAHESSHQWWGHRVGWKSYHDQWLSEGFAQFSGNLYVLYRQNEKEFLNRLQSDKRDLAGGDLRNRRYDLIGPVWMGTRLSSADAPRAYGVVVYSKGGYILHMIRMMMSDPRSQEPDARFIRMMQDFTQTYHNQPASTEDFKAMVDKHMVPAMDVDGSRKMDWFFNQYVYGIGMPQYDFTYQLQDAGNGVWQLVGTITQSGVPEGWKEALPIYVQVQGQLGRLGWIKVNEKVTTFNIPLKFKPEKAVLNAKEEILAQFKQ
ncbi:MAG TPA: M1 family aminopeptidase, partial [Candidatus Acidoferrales bacterium]|nr:M1 family aminopeptidase [Candidatus Acidoferrales bacterium]